MLNVGIDVCNSLDVQSCRCARWRRMTYNLRCSRANGREIGEDLASEGLVIIFELVCGVGLEVDHLEVHRL